MSTSTLQPRVRRRGVRGALREAIDDMSWADNAVQLAETMWGDYYQQKAAAETADSWLRGENEIPVLPSDQWAPDYKSLQQASPSAYIRVAIAEMTQCLYVEGHLPSQQKLKDGSTSRSFSEVWDKIWQPNRLDGRQIAVHRSAMAHGVAYVVAEKANITFTGEETVALRGVSALSGCALWRRGEVTEFPDYFIEVRESTDENGQHRDLIRIWDERWVYTIYRNGSEGDETGKNSEFIAVTREEHGASVCPVVAFCNDEDLDHRVQGEITPVIPILQRIDQDTFDRLIVQRFGSWRIRTATGVGFPLKEDDPTGEKTREIERTLSVGSLLTTNNENARFGTLEPTALEGYIAARDADLRDFASILQVPPHHILGLSPNVSAEGLVEAQASLMRKMEERQHLFGESWELVMRLAAHMLGMSEAAADFGAQVTWRDMESRSLAQIADALGKVAQMLEVPPELLWNRLPNWSQQDTELALELREELQHEEELMLAAEAKAAGNIPTAGRARSGLSPDEEKRIDKMRGGQMRDTHGKFD